MKICIIGGGTTGWMAAAHIEKHLPESTITLIESPTIPIMGVGESSLPQLRNFFLDLGLTVTSSSDSLLSCLLKLRPMAP